MSDDVFNEFDRARLEALRAQLSPVRCPDCNGRGKRWHAKWPLRVNVSYADPSEPIHGTDGGFQKEWKTCETCRGTGRTSPV